MKSMKYILTLGLFACAFGELLAQPNNPNDPVPLDGGLTLLLTAGAVYGAKKAYDKYKEKSI
jgi:hypothetical protein